MWTLLQSIPMGTVMTACLLIGAVGMLLVIKLPRSVQRTLAILLVLAGAWNAGWHGTRHIGQFWGQMALASGVAMLLAGVYCWRLDNKVSTARMLQAVVLALVLGGFGGYYGWTIYNL